MPSARRQTLTSMPDVATPPAPSCRLMTTSPVSGCWTSTSERLRGRQRPADADVAAAVDRDAAEAGRRASSASAASPLPVPPVSRRTPGGRAIDPCGIEDADVAPARGGVRAGRAARRRAPASASASGAAAIARARVAIAGGLERADERRVDEPAGPFGGPEPGADGGAQQRRRRNDRPRVAR